MKHLIRGIIVVGLATITSSISAFASDVTPNTSAQNRYETCLAYVKSKGIDFNCDVVRNASTLTGTVITGTRPTEPAGTPPQEKPNTTNPNTNPNTTNPSGANGLDAILKIRDPYEQCVAYVAFKKLANVDCKARTEELKNTQSSGSTNTTPPPKPNNEKCTTPGTRCDDKNPNINTGTTPPPKPAIGQCGDTPGGKCEMPKPVANTGSNSDENEMKEIIIRIGQLKIEERRDLFKIIRTYLASKNTIPTNISTIKKTDNTEIKTGTSKTQEEIKAKQIEIQKKYMEQIQSLRKQQ